LLKESIANPQTKLKKARKLRQKRADHMRSVNAQRSKELSALVANMESLFLHVGLDLLPALVVTEGDDGKALAILLRRMFVAFVQIEPLISDLAANDSASLLHYAGRRIFYHLQQLGIFVDLKELVRSAPKAKDLVKIDGGVRKEENIQQGLALLLERYMCRGESEPSPESSDRATDEEDETEGGDSVEDASSLGDAPQDDATSLPHA
jgi:hypothetical protein